MTTTTRTKASKTTHKQAQQIVRDAEVRINEHTTQGGQIAGHFVMWNLDAVLIEEGLLRAGLAEHGLLGLAPYAVRPKTAMRRAIASFLEDHQLVRLVTDTDEYSLYVIKQEFGVPGRDSMPDLDWSTELKMCWYKDEGNDPERALGFSKDPNDPDREDPRGAAVRPMVEKYLHCYVGTDIGELLRRGILMHRGISLRHGGGVYFYPTDVKATDTTQAEYLSHLKAFVSWIALECHSAGCYLSTFAIPAESDGVSDLGRHVNHALKAELKKVADDIRGIEERMRGQVNVSPETITKYLNQVQAMQQKAMLYVDLVHFQADEVTEMVQDLGARCHELINIAQPSPFEGV